MKGLYKFSVLLVYVFVLAGCYEDRAEITLNADGSGSVKQKLVFSEQLIIGMKDGDSGDKMLPNEKEELVKKIGDALKFTSITSTDLDDGGRIIEFEGTFSKPEQFFFSDYCQEHLNLRLAAGSDGKAVLYCQPYQSNTGGSGPSVEQLYGLAKGMYIKRVVNLCGKIAETNGTIGKKKKTVTWEIDLRNRKGFGRAKKFLESKDKGKGIAVFDGSKLKFSLPLKMTKKVTEAGTASGDGDGKLKCEVVWISTESKCDVKTGETKISKLELGIELTWEGMQPVAYTNYKLTSMTDEMGNDLVNENQWASRRPIRESEKKQKITLKSQVPGKDAKELRGIQGQVEVITGIVTEKVALENFGDLAGKESVGNAVLDKVNFKIKILEDHLLKISIDGGHKMIKSLDMLRADGSKIKTAGGMGGGDNYTYQFGENLNEAVKLEIEVITSEETVTVPFVLDKFVLP